MNKKYNRRTSLNVEETSYIINLILNDISNNKNNKDFGLDLVTLLRRKSKRKEVYK